MCIDLTRVLCIKSANSVTAANATAANTESDLHKVLKVSRKTKKSVGDTSEITMDYVCKPSGGDARARTHFIHMDAKLTQTRANTNARCETHQREDKRKTPRTILCNCTDASISNKAQSLNNRRGRNKLHKTWFCTSE